MGVRGGRQPGAGRPIGAKNKSTLLKEERRAIFEAEMSEMFIQKIREARPEYLLDQFMGKAEDKLDVTTKGERLDSLTPEQIAEINKIAFKNGT